jgi:hypothetical protein
MEEIHDLDKESVDAWGELSYGIAVPLTILTKPMHRSMSWALALLALLVAPVTSVRAQLSQVIFQDDFSASSIDPAKYTPDAPFFEGGKGDIRAEAGNGVIRFVGTTTQQWWSGGTLSVAGTYSASEESPVTFSIDRVSEVGAGTASRSALWILDEAGGGSIGRSGRTGMCRRAVGRTSRRSMGPRSMMADCIGWRSWPTARR